MQRLITLGFTLDLAADVATVWTDVGREELAATLTLALLAAAAGLYRYIMPATETDPAGFQVETIRR